MSRLLELDRSLFYMINHGWANPFLDRLFPWATHGDNLWPLLLLIILWLTISGGRRGRLFLLAAAVGLILSDPITVRIIKPMVDRVRPCLELDDVRLLISRRGSPSFPSAHATNLFAVLTVLWHHHRPAAWVAAPIAAFIALSRVYVGVHYPFDLVGGAILGLVIGSAVVQLHVRAARRYPRLASGLPIDAGDLNRSRE